MKTIPTTLTIMTFNIENGGTQINFNKVVEAIHQSGADIVGIQEAWGNIERLAKALHWPYYNRRQHVIARFPLLETEESKGQYLFVEVTPKKYVIIANLHLPDEPYGPYRINAGDKVSQVITMERKVRLQFALPTIRKIAAFAEQGMPVFVTGDFNSPSYLDWADHRGVLWPVTHTLATYGFKDAYRSVHPDPSKNRGFTWPALRPVARFSFDGFNPSSNDLADRIDFVFSGGNAHAVMSQVIGEADSKDVDLFVSPWPSDHRAVVAKFAVQPFAIAVTPITGEDDDRQQAMITVQPKMVKSGEPFKIIWRNTPGYGLDYVRISPLHSKKLGWGQVVRLYTGAKPNGSVIFNIKNAQGNWLAWYKADKRHWPLHPGIYDIKLMADDSETVVAETKITVID